ncbi:MAG: extracellular solute-binding protein [Rhodocyclaceae bacterium]|nr:extracellular solute-binding protein [Rhodocyclaceae bacterium]
MKHWIIGVSLAASVTLAGAQEVVLRHNLQGKALDTLATMTLKFNDAQKGKAKVVLQNANSLSPVDKAHLPHAALLDLDESSHYFSQRPRFVPFHQLIKDSGEKISVSDFYPQIVDAVADSSGRMQALPAGLAIPVLFRNKAYFAKAGLDPEKAPATWAEVQFMAGKLFDAGYQCPLTSTYFSRLHGENVATQHGQGVTIKGDKGALNTLINVKHLALLTSWQKSRYFHYYGPHREAEDKFLSGECAMITADSTMFSRLSPTEGVHAGASELPYHDDTYTMTPERVLPEGASLWTLAGKKKDEYKVLARFIKFFLEPQNQRDWVKTTAFMPMSRSAMTALREAGAFSPRLLDSTDKRLSSSHKDSGLIRNEVSRSRMRAILDEEVETVWANKKPPKQALDEAMQRYNSGK